jgi:hypothetical protein
MNSARTGRWYLRLAPAGARVLSARMMKSALLATLLAFAACGGAKTKSTTETTVKPADDAAAVLALADLKFYDGDEMGVHLFPDGRLQMLAEKGGSWIDIATLKADGSITSPKGETAHVTADGTITGPDGKVAPFKLDGAALVIEAKRITINDKGEFLMDGKADTKSFRVEGATDAKTQRTALIVAALMLASGGQKTDVDMPAAK